MAGLRVIPDEKWTLGVDVIWTSSDASLDPLRMSAPEWAATHPLQSYDFSQTHTFSDLDIEWLQASLSARYMISQSFWINGGFRYADWDDQAPYLYDQTGSLESWSLAFGRKF